MPYRFIKLGAAQGKRGAAQGIADLSDGQLARLGLVRREECERRVQYAIQLVAQGALLRIEAERAKAARQKSQRTSRRKPQPKRRKK